MDGLCKMRLVNSLVLLLAVASCGCYALETGNLTVIFSDTDGKPITNATVKVTTSKGAIWGYGNESEYYHYEGHSDSNGVASIDFGFRDADFDWDVETPSHYSQAFTFKRECFDNVVEESDYLHVDTNTVEGLARYEELRRLYYADDAESYVQYISKMQPKNITYTNKRIVRSVCFYPKRNPQPMCVYGEADWPDIPLTETVTEKAGYTMVVYPAVDFDLERSRAYAASGTNCGTSVDFRLERYYVETNGVANFYGRMAFAPGCGAYRCKQTADESFPSCYEADTNAIFESHIDFYTVKDIATGRIIVSRKLVAKDEFVVLRTRMQMSADGETNGWHYSKLLGPGRINGNLYFDQSVFNPRLNDPNLEHDITIKPLGHSHSCLLP